MNWEAIGAGGEVFGALGVMVTLIYLATQIRVQNRESRIASVHEISEGYRQLVAEMIYPNLSEVWVKAVKDWTRKS